MRIRRNRYCYPEPRETTLARYVTARANHKMELIQLMKGHS